MGQAFSGGAEFSVCEAGRNDVMPSAPAMPCNCAAVIQLDTATIPPLMKSSRVFQIVVKVLNSPRVIFLIALIARLRVLSQLLPLHGGRNFYQYNEPSHIAWALISGFGYSAPWPNTPVAATAQQPPLYPLLLAAIFKLTGAYTYLSLWIAVGLNAIFSAFTAVLILRLGKRDFSFDTGLLAAWVWACWQYEAVVSIRLWESSLSAFLLVSVLWLLPELADSLRVSRWLLFGALAGIAALINTTLLGLFPFFWLWLWARHRRRGRACYRELLASIGVCVLVLLPWTIRNYAALHRLIPIRDNFGLELWVGLELRTGPSITVVTQPFPQDFPLNDPTEYNRLGEIRFMDSRREMAFNFIRQHPGRFLNMMAIRSIKYWTEPAGTAWPAVSLLAWLGMCLALWRKRLDAAPYAVVLVVFPLVYYLTHTFPTYRHPIEPVMLLLAAYVTVAAAWPFRRSSVEPNRKEILSSR
jgi:Dolichyl-phosphate-mannose-protein mannosyltransferase